MAPTVTIDGIVLADCLFLADVAIIGVYNPYEASFEYNYLKTNQTTEEFFACKNIPYGPNHVSKNYFALMHYFGKFTWRVHFCIS